MYLLACLVILLLLVLAFERFYLRGAKLDQYREPVPADVQHVFKRPGGPGPQHGQVADAVRELTANIARATRKRDMRAVRAVIDSLTDERDYTSEFLPVNAAGIPAEWVIAPGADNQRRVLYIHGGGFIMGSPKSHRTITSEFSRVSGCAVLAIDYRLMPEHQRMDGVEDCRAAYSWLLENGPDGACPAREIYIGGDSAGGNLALSLSAWLRDNGPRTPDAVVALSPLTDCTFSGASLRANEATDVMLKNMLKTINRLPQFFKSWWALAIYRGRPSNPVMSPVFGDLAGLPPTLVQASEAEMLLDDARSYVNKAHASGSPVTLQTWTDMVHVWQIFSPELPQAAEAWTEIGKFLQARPPASGQPAP